MATQESELKKTNGRGRTLLVVGGGFILLAVLLVFFNYSSNQADSSDIGRSSNQIVGENSAVSLPASGPPLQVGDLPYDFTLTDLAGNEAALHTFIGRPLIVNFWATWCAPCRIEMPHLQHTFETHQEQGLAVLALNQDETAADVTGFFDEFGLTFTPLLDVGNATSQNYGVGRILPTTFFINPEGEITAVHRGPMTQSQIDGYLVDTLP